MSQSFFIFVVCADLTEMYIWYKTALLLISIMLTQNAIEYNTFQKVNFHSQLVSLNYTKGAVSSAVE